MPEKLSRMIAELEALQAQIEPGNWEWACDFEIGSTRHWHVKRTTQPKPAVCLGLVSMATEKWSLRGYPTPEMQLFVAARNAVPALLGEIRRLRAEIAATRREVVKHGR